MTANVQPRSCGDANVRIRTKTTEMKLPRAATMAAADDASLAKMANAASRALLWNELRHNELDMRSNQCVLKHFNEFNSIIIAFIVCVIVIIIRVIVIIICNRIGWIIIVHAIVITIIFIYIIICIIICIIVPAVHERRTRNRSNRTALHRTRKAMKQIINRFRIGSSALFVYKRAIRRHGEIPIIPTANVAATLRQSHADVGRRRLRIEQREERRAERPIGQRIREETAQTHEIYTGETGKPVHLNWESWKSIH